jgi:hypothetical protein
MFQILINQAVKCTFKKEYFPRPKYLCKKANGPAESYLYKQTFQTEEEIPAENLPYFFDLGIISRKF